MILVTGANGNFAGATIANLKASGTSFAVTTRNIESDAARALRHDGIDVRYADFDQPASLPAAFAGIETALLVSTMAPNDARLGQNLAALEAAKTAGVERVVYTSFINAGPTSHAEHSQLVHYPTEQAILTSGLSYTILRHALYAEMWTGDLDAVLSTGVVARPGGDAACSFIPRADLGRSAARVLTDEGPANRIYTETMPEALTGPQIAALIGKVFETDIRYQPVAATDWPAYMNQHWGVPLDAGQSAIGTMRAVETGEFDIVTDDYAAITGQPAATWYEYLMRLREARAGTATGR